MNQTFKVVFSAARGALMVVNELTRTVQGKGTKTVVAVAMVGGLAMAGNAQALVNESVEQFQNGFSGLELTEDVFKISESLSTDTGAVYKDNVRASDSDMVFGTIFYTASNAAQEFTLSFNQAVFEGNVVRGTRSSDATVAGGVAMIKGTSSTDAGVTFTDSVFRNNRAEGTSTMMVGGGALYLDAAKNNTVGTRGATALIRTTTDLVYSGNDVSASDNGQWYELYGSLGQSGGGFLYLDRKARMVFDVQSGTLTIGEAGNTSATTDSIQSSIVNKKAEASSIEKTGAGTLTVHSDMSRFYGTLRVSEGVMNVSRDVSIYNEWTVSGGELHLADVEIGQIGTGSFGAFKRGESSNTANFEIAEGNGSAGRLVVSGGAVTAGAVTVSGVQAAAYVLLDAKETTGYGITVSGGSLIVDSLDLRKGDVSVTGGLLSVGTLTTDEKLAAQSIVLNGGTLDLKLDDVFGTTENERDTTAKSIFELKAGTLDFSDETVTKSWLTEALTDKNFTIAVNVKGDDGEPIKEVTTDELFAGVILPEAELTVEGSTVVLGKANAGVQTITSEKPLGTVTVSESFTLIGDGTTVLGNEHEDGATITVAENKTLTLGLANGSGGGTIQGSIDSSGNLAVAGGDFAVNGGIKTNTLNVAAGAALTTTSVTLAANSTVSGELTADSLSLSSGTVSVEGTLGVSTLAADVTLEDGGTLLLNAADQTQKAVPVMALARSFALTPRAEEVPVTASLVNGTVTANAGALVTTREGGEALVKSAAEKAGITYDSTKAGFYVDSQILLGENGKFKIGTTSDTNDVNLGSDALMVVDASAFAEGVAAIAHRDDSAVTVTSENATLILSNLTNRQTDTITVFDGASSIERLNVKSDSIFYTPTLGDDGSVTVETKQGADLGITDSELAAAVNAITAVGSGASATLTTYLDQLGKETSGYVNNGKFTAAAQNALRTTLTLPVASGALNVAYDAQSLVNDAVTNRALAVKGQGTQARVDLFGTTNEAKYEGLTTGYDADIYGGVFGVDTTLDNGLLVGGAVTIGTADTDATGTAYKVTTDTDFYGFSLYGAKTFAGLNVKADVGYTKFDNTVKAYDLGQKLGGDADADAWTVGLRGDFTAVDAAVAVKPHFGVRYTRLTVDGLNGVDVSNLNVIELPVGVAFEGAVEAGGWKIAPALDLSVVPQLGDDEVTTSVAGEAIRTTVLDNLYNAALGVSAEYQSMTFGLNYRYGFGSNDRSNNALHATFRYAF